MRPNSPSFVGLKHGFPLSPYFLLLVQKKVPKKKTACRLADPLRFLPLFAPKLASYGRSNMGARQLQEPSGCPGCVGYGGATLSYILRCFSRSYMRLNSPAYSGLKHGFPLLPYFLLFGQKKVPKKRLPLKLAGPTRLLAKVPSAVRTQTRVLRSLRHAFSAAPGTKWVPRLRRLWRGQRLATFSSAFPDLTCPQVAQ